MGGQLQPLEALPPLLAVLLITAVIAFFTEFASNTATIIIFLPVLAELVRLQGGGQGGGAALGVTRTPTWLCVSPDVPGAV